MQSSRLLQRQLAILQCIADFSTSQLPDAPPHSDTQLGRQQRSTLPTIFRGLVQVLGSIRSPGKDASCDLALKVLDCMTSLLHTGKIRPRLSSNAAGKAGALEDKPMAASPACGVAKADEDSFAGAAQLELGPS